MNTENRSIHRIVSSTGTAVVLHWGLLFLKTHCLSGLVFKGFKSFLNETRCFVFSILLATLSDA